MYRRKGSNNWNSKVLTQTGYLAISWRTSDRALAKRMDGMWSSLASQRQWSLLQPVLDGTVSVGELYDLWERSKHDADRMRQQSADMPLAPLVNEWEQWYSTSGIGPTASQQASAHVRWFLDKAPSLQSWDSRSIASRLATYPGSTGTQRKVHTALSSFLGYLVRHGLMSSSPMTQVSRPSSKLPPVRFYEPEQVAQIVAETRKTSPEMAVLFAFLYASAADLDSALRVTVADVKDDQRVWVEGTKTDSRPRFVHIASVPWDLLLMHRVSVLSAGASSRLWTWRRWWPSHEHRRVVQALGLPVYPLRNARHHYAATRLRDGWPLPLIQQQLGHANPRTTLEKYARFIPSTADFNHYENLRSSRMREPVSG